MSIVNSNKGEIMAIKKGSSKVGANKELEAVALVLADNPVLRTRVMNIIQQNKGRFAQKDISEKTTKKDPLAN